MKNVIFLPWVTKGQRWSGHSCLKVGELGTRKKRVTEGKPQVVCVNFAQVSGGMCWTDSEQHSESKRTSERFNLQQARQSFQFNKVNCH